MERSLSYRRRIAAFVSGLFVLTTLGAVPAARAGIGDSPLPSFSDNTPSVTVLRVPGVINRTGTATVFLCSSVDSANVHIGVEVFDDAGVLQNDVHAGAGAVLNVAPGATVTISTSGTGAFLESAIVTVSAFFAQGSARVVASSSKVHCNAMVTDDAQPPSPAPPVSLSTLGEGTQLLAGAVPSTQPLPTFSDAKPATASAVFTGAVKRGQLETAIFCTSLAASNVDIGVELLARDGSLANSVATGNGAVLNVAPGQTVTFGTTGTVALLETSVILLPSIDQGVARVVSTSSSVLCNAISLDAALAPPASTTNLAGYGADAPGAGATLPVALPQFFDLTPSVQIAMVPGVVKRGLLQTVFLCSSRASSPVNIGVQVFDRNGILQNDVTTDVGVVRDVAPGATVTIATSTTAAYLESTVIPLQAGLQGVARIVASAPEVSCTTVIVDDSVSPPATLATIGAAVEPYAGALPSSVPLPTFSSNHAATHVAVFPGLVKRDFVETDIFCTSLASAPIDIGVQVFTPAGTIQNDVSTVGGALIGVAPGETVAFGTTGTAALFENLVIVLPPIAQGMARVVSNSGDLVCSGVVLDDSLTPPTSMTALAGFAGSCGDAILQPGEQCDGALDAACPGNCDNDCLCPPVCGDGFVQSGEACDDGNLAGGDCCSAGCQLECSDGNICTQDSCNPVGGVCTFAAAPVTSCREAGRSSIQLKLGTTGAKNQMKWKWSSGPQVHYGEIGNPDSTSTNTICVYDSTGSVPSLASSLTLPPSLLWTTKFPKSWGYSDRDALVDGISGMKVQAGVDGRAKMSMKAAGASLPMPNPASPSLFFNQQPNVVVQLRNEETSACWQSTFTIFTTNDGVSFKAKAP